MLKFMREQASSWLIKGVLWLVVIAFIATIFVSWGMGGYEDNEGIVAEVHDEKIYYKEYKEIRDNLNNYYRENLKGINVDELFPASQLNRVALNTLIQRKLLLHEAKAMGIEAPNQEIIDRIRQIPSFQREGRFDKDIYLNFIKLNRTTAKKFEKNQRAAILLTKIEKLVKDSVKASELEVREAYHWKHEKIKLDYLVIGPELFRGKEELTEEKITEFYQKEKERFRVPDQIKVEYLLAEPNAFEKEVKIDSQDLEEYYKDHQDLFMDQEKVRASHILIKKTLADFDVKADDDSNKRDNGNNETPKNASRIKAEKILDELKNGQNFEELAKKQSEDETNAEEGGDLGYFTRGTMERKFEEVAFSLKIGKLSEIVETIYGYHIIKVTGKVEEGIRPLSDVKEEINEILVQKKSKKLAKRALTKILKTENPINEFEKYSAEGPIVKRMTEFFSLKDLEIPLIGRSSQFKIAAFRLKENQTSGMIEIDGGFYLQRLIEKKDSYILKLEEVKDQVAEALSLLEQDAMAKLEVDRLLDELKKGKSIDSLAKEVDIETSHKDFFDREQAASSFSGNNEYVHALFQIKEKEFAVIPDAGKYHLVYMVERAGFDEESYKKEKDSFLKTFLQEKQEKTMGAWLENLRKKAKVTINESIL